MASEGRKKDKFTILEDIYHDDISAKPAKTQIKEYFSDSNRIEKFLSAGILAVGLVALLLGLFQIRDNLNPRAKIAKKTPVMQIDKNDLLGQKNKDTDQDGLSDYDELFVYKSSPYLRDTDSDGIDDRVEIIGGSDPACPEGQNCFAVWSENPLLNPEAGSTTTPETNIDPAQLREMLAQAGMTADQLSALTDDEIINAYQQIMSQQTAEAATAQTTAAPTVNVTMDQIKNLTPAQIRELLVSQANIPQVTLDQISDEELTSLVNETLANYQTNGN